jgi:hypothetical protein
MALDETIIWTICPNGYDPQTRAFSLSVHVSPRLTTGGTGDRQLASWPDFLGGPNWAQLRVGFQVEIQRGAAHVPVGTLGAALAGPDERSAAVWDAIFGPPTSGALVHERVVDTHPTTPVLSYPMSNIARFLETNYGDVANAYPDDHPPVADLATTVGTIGFAGPDGQKRRDSLVAALASTRNAPDPNAGLPGRNVRSNSFTASNDTRDFLALTEFHRSRSSKRLLPVEKPAPDFHQLVALAGNHPLLLRRLGLVFDLQFSDFTGALQASGQYRIRLVPAVQLGAPPGITYTQRTPWTVCNIDTAGVGTFEARPSGPTIVGRHLAIGLATEFDVLEVDPDGGGLKLQHLADNMALARLNRTDDTPDRQSLPSLREAGFQIVQKERGTKFVAMLNRVDSLQAGLASDPDLFAEDLTRGYVLDVFDVASNAWRSTAQRVGRYHFPAGPADVPIDDEAPFSAPPTSSANPADPKQFHLQESLVRWDGWSLAANRPGLPIQENDAVGAPAPGGTPYGVDIQTKVKPGTLPRLRFGRQYRLRVRTMDIAGNVLPLADGAPATDVTGRVSAPQTYWRFDPVVSPDLLIRSVERAPFPGESGGVLVIRGNHDLDAPDTAVRYVAPPRAGQITAELHEKFDVAIGTAAGADQTAVNADYARITTLESGSYGSLVAPDTTVPVPFLPDPLAQGATFRVMDGPHAGERFPVRFEVSAWPAYQPFELRLKHAATQTIAVDPQRRVSAGLTKADVITLRLSCTLPAGAAARYFGIREWASKRPGFGATFDADADAGRHWLITPFRTVQLVYAVRQPLVEPTFGVIAASRQTGDTFAHVRGTVKLSAKSTGQLDLEARWTEPLDRGPGTGVPDEHGINGRAHAFAIDILADDQDFQGRHEFHDTKHRNVDYWLVATSRFTEHFVGRHPVAAAVNGSPVVLDALGLQPDSVRVLRAGTTLRAGVAFTTDDAAGTITFPAGAAPDHVQPGDALDVTFLPPVSRRTPDAGHRIVNVPSSARPLSPDVAYVVPIFEWSPVTAAGATIESKRTGAGVRVYLNRPWWSSGEGELLGVVTWPPAEDPSPPAAPQEIRSFVTQWGNDPVFAGASLPTVLPRTSSFPASAPGDRRTGLSIDERPGSPVNVAGHHVAYDADRDLYYCDVPVAAGDAYTPFIRLAVARYQPDSILDAHLSRVVLVDFLQLTADRTATIVMKTPQLIASLTLTGPSYLTASGRKGPGLAEATIEVRDPAIADETLGWRPVGAPIPLSAASLQNGLGVWAARLIKLPKTDQPLRIVLEQYEVLVADARSPSLRAVAHVPTARRLVYTDIVPIA